MKAVFVYDGPIQIDLEGNFYSPVINNKVFNRYLNHADELSVAIRVEPLNLVKCQTKQIESKWIE